MVALASGRRNWCGSCGGGEGLVLLLVLSGGCRRRSWCGECGGEWSTKRFKKVVVVEVKKVKRLKMFLL